MTTATQQTNTRRWVLSFLAALVAVLTIVGLAGTASANEKGVSQTRVGASNLTVAVLVEPPEHISAGQRLGKDVAGHQIVVATGVAAKTTTRVVDDAFEHGYTYHPRIRQRAVEDPRAHNFPYSFDDVILREKPITQTDGSLLYRKSGEINGKPGVYEIANNPDSGVIFHRTWRGTR